MLSQLARELPEGPYIYEPKWDGFRCLVFRDGPAVDLRSRNQRELARYFPEVVAAVRTVAVDDFVLDGELVVAVDGTFDFGALMSRIHPAASRVDALAAAHPATYVAFDLLAVRGSVLMREPFTGRRERLVAVLTDPRPGLMVTPATTDRDEAARWLHRHSGGAIDGVMAKHRDGIYEPGRRAMVKVKLERTADCVVGGFRFDGETEPRVTSLLLGLYDDERALVHVGVAGSFRRAQARSLWDTLVPRAVPLASHPWRSGFNLGPSPMGRLRGSAGRWTPDMTLDWVPLAPELVCEVAFDQVDGQRLRHPARWRRWRPDRDPRSCSISQLTAVPDAGVPGSGDAGPP